MSAEFVRDKFRQKELVFEPQNLPSLEEQSTKAKEDDSEKQQQRGQEVQTACITEGINKEGNSNIQFLKQQDIEDYFEEDPADLRNRGIQIEELDTYHVSSYEPKSPIDELEVDYDSYKLNRVPLTNPPDTEKSLALKPHPSPTDFNVCYNFNLHEGLSMDEANFLIDKGLSTFVRHLSIKKNAEENMSTCER